ncbi:hypothetical protein MMYC01_209502 [Madurella mycetomatis]|uniref:Uncharacterized protein n=1 Tax=Madurella mycetomatis TaxID=100816 RepID=A0A175VVY4_9PEZI|nr:hypothetical protein MMYC01_209502 [Madurella mycetomatis]
MASTAKPDPHTNADIGACLRGEIGAELNFIVPPKDGSAPFVTEGPEGESVDEYRQPILFVHCDHTGKVAEKFAREHVSQEGAAEELLQGRKHIINVWRPLNGPVQTMPMTFCRPPH